MADAVVDVDDDLRRNRTPSGWPTQSRPPDLSCEMNGRSYRLKQGRTHEGLHVLLWPVSRLMVRYVERHRELFRGATVLELGAGVGLAGLGAAAYGARVLLTDRDIRLTAANVEAANGVGFSDGGAAEAAALDWVDGVEWVAARERGGAPPFDWVFGSDIVYHGGDHEQYDFSHVQALARLLAALEGPRTRVLFGYQERDCEARLRFLDALAAEGLAVEERSLEAVAAEGVVTDGLSGPIVLWWISRAARLAPAAAPAQ